jgi:hypothetical protein
VEGVPRFSAHADGFYCPSAKATFQKIRERCSVSLSANTSRPDLLCPRHSHPADKDRGTSLAVFVDD